MIHPFLQNLIPGNETPYPLHDAANGTIFPYPIRDRLLLGSAPRDDNESPPGNRRQLGGAKIRPPLEPSGENHRNPEILGRLTLCAFPGSGDDTRHWDIRFKAGEQ